MEEEKYEIIEEIGSFKASMKNWRYELNKVSRDGEEPKYEISKWRGEREKKGRGRLTLTKEELINLKALIEEEVEYLLRENG